MDLAIRVNVRYAAPPNSQIKDALRLFKSPRWVQSIIRYIMPQLNSISPTSVQFVDEVKKVLVHPMASSEDKTPTCVVCMEGMHDPCCQLPCGHQFHSECLEPWLKMHSTCPTCRSQLPTDASVNYSVYAINTTIILQQWQARMPTAELLELPASDQVIRAVVNARVRRNSPSSASQRTADGGLATLVDSSLPTQTPVMNASVLQRSPDGFAACITEPVVPMLHRNATRRRFREETERSYVSKRQRLDKTGASEQDISARC